MLHTLLVAIHVVGAIGGLIMGALAFIFPNGTRRHRLIGKLYLVAWLVIAATGYTLGAGDARISPFEIATSFGVFSTAYAYAVVLLRKRIGAGWVAQHYRWMIGSLTGLLIATINQVLPRTGVEYPIWVFIVICASPAVLVPFFGRRLDRRYLRRAVAPQRAPISEAV